MAFVRESGHEVIAHQPSPLRGWAMRQTKHLRTVSNGRSLQRGLTTLLVGSALAILELSAHAGSTFGTLANATFINSANPNNNNGGASLIYVGNDANSGSMRGLILFNLPSPLNERVVITSTSLTMYTGSLVGSSLAAATVSLYRLTENWGQGSGVAADFTGDYTVGQPCTAGGATWNQPLCLGAWSTGPGGGNVIYSTSASVPAASGQPVNWSGMMNDVQAWANTPSSNYGWLLVSSTETTYDNIQPFSKSATTLNITFSCRAGFLETASGCTTCTAAANAACVTAQSGNTCNDSGPPSTSYSCACDNPAYIVGPGGTSCFLDLIFENGFE